MTNMLQLGRAAIDEVGAYLTISGTYSEPCQTFKKEFFCENSSQFSTVNYFCKSFVLNVWQGSDCTSKLLNWDLDYACQTLELVKTVAKLRCSQA